MAITSDATSVIITHPSNPQTSLKILHFGATAISWKVAGTEKLWMSEAAKLDGTRAVRGGIPIVFPRFGPPKGNHPVTDSLPQHGFARNVYWEFLGQVDETSVQYGLSPDQLTPEFREKWGYDFKLLLTFVLSETGIDLKFDVENTDSKPFDFTALLHTYFYVPEIEKTTLDGVENLNFWDIHTKTDHVSPSGVQDFHAEFDRIYKSTPRKHVIYYENKPLYTLESTPSLADTVVWQPWLSGAKTMTDFEPKESFHTMLCVENGAVKEFINLKPNETFKSGLHIEAN